MKAIDYTSDLHLDFVFKPGKPISDKAIEHHFDPFFSTKQSNVLLIAGDIGHYMFQNIHILSYIKSKYGYEYIVLVMGNHEGYLLSSKDKYNYKNGWEKINASKKMYEEAGFIVLDGTSVTIDGVTIGGADSWYDGTVYYQNTAGWYQSSGGIETHWKNTMNDPYHMKITDFFDKAKEEKDKLKTLIGQCDIIMTHVKPVVEQRFFAEQYKHKLDNAYYSFDWIENIVDDPKLKVWVHGHTHTVEEWDVFGKKMVCNAHGYGKDSIGNTVKTVFV